MRTSNHGRGQTLLAIVLVIITMVAAALLLRRQTDDAQQLARAGFHDQTPLGGKGLRLVLERLGHTVKRANVRLSSIPKDARVWLLLDPKTRFSQRETQQLLAWVRTGNTLILAVPPRELELGSLLGGANGERTGTQLLCEEIGIERPSAFSFNRSDEILPPLKPLSPGAASVYWSGVKSATASTGQIEMRKERDQAEPEFLEIAGNPIGPTLLLRRIGRGRIIVAPDALLFTNYALSKSDNAVLVTNLVRFGTPATATIYYDERQHGDEGSGVAAPDNWLRYLQVPAVRAALLQLAVAALFMWLLAGTRLGAAVPLRESEPVTRASNFARAMGALFHKAGRTDASGAILAFEFRRSVARRVGLSPGDAPQLIAERAALAADLPQPLLLRLLSRADVVKEARRETLLDAAPRAMERLTTGSPEARSEDELLRDAQEMEDVMRRLGIHR